MNDVPASAPLAWNRPQLRYALFGLSGAVALYVGFVLFSVESARGILRHGSYYFILVTVALWIWTLARVWRDRQTAAPITRREWLVAAVAVIGLTVLAVAHETFRSKILYDEYVLQSTAANLHFFRENSVMIRGYEVQGVFVSLDSYVDKRPIFFPFLVATLHDLTGYRTSNVYVVNIALFAFSLTLMYVLGRRISGHAGGLLAAGLLGSLPLFAQNASGAGMELLNVCMVLAVMVLMRAWLQRPDNDRLSAFVLGTVLLIQSRYESALYVVPVGLAILFGWWRARRVVLSWPAILAPCLLIPVALQQKMVANSPVMWELRENQTARFSTNYLGPNLKAAWDFLSSGNVAYGNSLLLGTLGGMAAIALGWRAWRQRRRGRELTATELTLLLGGAGMAATTVMVMFYYWAEFNDPMASRFALPLCLLLALMIVVAAGGFDRRWPATRLALALMALFLVGVSVRKQAYHLYSHLGNDEIEWERRFVAARSPEKRLILTNKSPLPWVIEHKPAILLSRARAMADRIEVQLGLPDFREILVFQSARPSSAEGDYEIVPEEVLPPWFHLEVIAERRFGTKLARISRLVAIDLPADFNPSNPPVEMKASAAEGSRL